MEGCTREAGPSSAGIRVWHREQGIECIENIPVCFIIVSLFLLPLMLSSPQLRSSCVATVE
jgi:hypothetical protein